LLLRKPAEVINRDLKAGATAALHAVLEDLKPPIWEGEATLLNPATP